MTAHAPANVRVVVRVRPLNDSELSLNGTLGRTNVVALESKSNGSATTSETIGIHCDSADVGSSSLGSKYFTFDAVHGPKSRQTEVFESVKEIVDAVTSGYNGTVVAYGQTGSGKSFTVFGNNTGDDESVGLVQRSLRAIFDRMSPSKSLYSANDNEDESLLFVDSIKTEFRASFLEIFNDRVYDLLSSADALEIALSVREDARGVYVDGLKEVTVSSADEAEQILRSGISNRHVASTNMNRASSRSHAVFTLNIRSEHTTPEGLQKIRLSKFTLVDLAGSERQKKTAVLGERLKEASMINKSLLCLGHVINALVDREAGRERHIPFRDSKLTFLLRDSWGGNSKTCLIATISPSAVSIGETISTLNFAQRAKLIKNTAVLNEDTCGSIAALQAEILRLRSLLQNNTKVMTSSEPELSIISDDAYISFMRRRASKAEQKACLLEHEITEKTEVIQTLKRKLDEAVMVRKFKERRIEYFEKTNGNMDEKEQMSLLQKEVVILRNELDKPSVGAIHWKAEYERLKEEVASFKSDASRGKDAGNEELSKLNDTIMNLMREKEDHIRSISELTQTSTEAREEIDVLLQEIDRLELEISSLQDKLKEADFNSWASSSRATDAEAELSKLKAVIDFQVNDALVKENDSQTLLLSLQNQLINKESEFATANVDLQKMKVDFEELQALRGRLDNEKAITINKLELMVSTLQREVMERESDISHFSSASEAMNVNLSRLTAELSTVREEAASKEREYDDEIKRLRSHLEEKQIEISQTRDELTEAKRCLSSLGSKVHIYSKELADIVNGIVTSAGKLNFDNDDIISMFNGHDQSSEILLDNGFELLRRAVSMLFSSLCSRDLQIASKKEEVMPFQQDLLSLQTAVSRSPCGNLTYRKEISYFQDPLLLERSDGDSVNTPMVSQNLETQILTLQQSCSVYEAEVCKLQSVCSSCNQEIDDIKKQLLLYQSEYKILETSALKSEEEKTILTASYEENISRMEKFIFEKDRQLHSISKQLAESESLNINMSAEIVDARQKIFSCENVVSLLQHQLMEKENDLVCAQGKYISLEADLILLKSETTSSCMEYEDSIFLLRNEISRLSETHKSLVSDIERDAISHKNLVDQLYSELQEKDINLRESLGQLLEAEDKVCSLNSALSDLGKQYDKKLSVIQEKEEAGAKKCLLLEDRITLLKREKNSLNFELDTLKEDHDTLMDQVRYLGERIQSLETENSSLKQESSSSSSTSIENNSLDDRDGCSSVKSEIAFYDSTSYTALSTEMDVFLTRHSSASSWQSKNGRVDDSMDESLFLPNNDPGAHMSTCNENANPKDTCGIETPIKKDYAMRRQPLSELKQCISTPIISHTGDSKLSSKKKVPSGKHRSTWMMYDNSKIFDR